MLPKALVKYFLGNGITLGDISHRFIESELRCYLKQLSLK